MDQIDKRRRFIINTVYFAIVIAIIYFVTKYLLGWVMPFIIGYGIALMFKPLIKFLDKHISVSKKAISVAVLIICYSALILLLWLLGSKLAAFIGRFMEELPKFYQFTIKPAFEDFNVFAANLASRLSPDLVEQFNDVSSNIMQSVQNFTTNLSTSALDSITNFGAKIPSFLISLLFAIMSSIFICMDYDRVSRFIMKQLPPRASEIFLDTKDYFIGTIFKYIKAALILMVITFVELSLGLIVLGTEQAILKAALISIADALPVIGTGGIVIPWIIFELISQNFTFAFGLLIVYVIITVVRSIIEPRIIGSQLGLHPVVSLAAVYIGLRLFGILGMILLPIIVTVIINLNDAGKIKLYKKLETEKKQKKNNKQGD